MSCIYLKTKIIKNTPYLILYMKILQSLLPVSARYLMISQSCAYKIKQSVNFTDYLKC